MKKKLFIIAIILSITALIYAIGSRTSQSNEDFPYKIYNSKGSSVSLQQMVNEISTAEVCLFGEFHNDPISHWLELRTLKQLYKIKGEHLIFGGEMWERDQQNITDECVKEKLFSINTYVENTHQWPNFKTDYAPLMQFCQDNMISLICTNIPRRYARLVSEQGDSILYSLPEYAKSFLPPLPVQFNFSEKSYLDFSEMMKMQAMQAMKKSTVENLIKAQALKDASMAYWITKSITPNSFFFHINGEFHSSYHSGIVYYLKLYNPRLKIKTISTQYAPKNKDEKIDFNKADFNIVIPEDMTKSY